MSVDLNWETLTGGADGQSRAERIRAFIHDKFQQVPFPKFIKSVQVHSFSFGAIPPDIEIKDICGPYPEFYEQDDEEDSDDDSTDGHDEEYLLKLEREMRRRERKLEDASGESSAQPPPYSVAGAPKGGHLSISNTGLRTPVGAGIDSFPGRVGVTGVNTPLFSPPGGGTSNLHYFHSALSSGFNQPPTQAPYPPSSSGSKTNQGVADSPTPGISMSPTSRRTSSPTVPRRTVSSGGNSPTSVRQPYTDDGYTTAPVPRLWEPRDEDTQIIARVKYAGDVKLELTAELLFEYPVSNFVALPVRLLVTGCIFDGLACVAYIRRRAHFCFLDQDPDVEGGGMNGTGRSLLKQINVESEIGEKGKGKQVLKNVGKVERFVLEQVRRIFEEEFVFPSSWTLLV